MNLDFRWFDFAICIEEKNGEIGSLSGANLKSNEGRPQDRFVYAAEAGAAAVVMARTSVDSHVRHDRSD